MSAPALSIDWNAGILPARASFSCSYRQDVCVPYSLHAQWILTGTNGLRNELHWHYVNVKDDVIDSVTNKPSFDTVLELGKGILVPGLLNMHTHLELSQIEKPIPVQMDGDDSSCFTDWALQLIKFRNSQNYNAEIAIKSALNRGELKFDTALICDVVKSSKTSNVTENFPGQKLDFLELIAWNREKMLELLNRYHFHENKFENFWGLSPHAPYTVCPELLEMVVKQNKLVMMHLAETPEEIEFLYTGMGAITDFMRLAAPDYYPNTVRVGNRALDYLKLLSEAPKALIVHGCLLDDEELRFLAKHRESMSVVYCPRSHAHFSRNKYQKYPLRKMIDFGVRVVFGTDSLASTPNLSMRDEIEFVISKELESGLEFHKLIDFATRESAEILGLSDRFGQIAPGFSANFAFFGQRPAK